jgi:hypothetical protein
MTATTRIQAVDPSANPLNLMRPKTVPIATDRRRNISGAVVTIHSSMRIAMAPSLRRGGSSTSNSQALIQIKTVRRRGCVGHHFFRSSFTTDIDLSAQQAAGASFSP